MKINKFLLGAFALSVGFASCSNEEPIKGDNGGATEASKYMSVAISNLANGSRAEDDDPAKSEFESAETIEGSISKENLYFLFYDGYGKAFGLAYANVNAGQEDVITNMVKPAELSSSEGYGDEEGLKGVLVLGKPTAPYVGQLPAKVLCVANPRTDVMKSLENKNLNVVINTLTTAPTSWTKAGDFLMTNAVYVKNGTVITAIDLDASAFSDTPEGAKNNPVVISLERLTAKIRVAYEENFDVQRRPGKNEPSQTIENPGKFNLDGADARFTASIEGWQLVNIPSQANAFKKLEPDNYAGWNWKWNDVNRGRSYWAESTTGTFTNKDYDIYSENQFKNQSFVSGTANVQYCYENTTVPEAKVSDRNPNVTAIVVKATIKHNGQPINMYKWSGAYYTEDRIKEKVAQQYNADDHTIQATKDNVSFEPNKKGDNTHRAIVTINDVKTAVPQFSEVQHWVDGVTSYYMNIEHLGGLTGVVRNHIYDYVIDGIVGLGTPGNETENPAVIESYLAAHVRILNWRTVSNTVTLE